MMLTLIERINHLQESLQFSGSVLVKNQESILFESSYGYANRSEQIKNHRNTRFGIASGCKVFTSIAICQLVEKGILTFDTPLIDCLDVDFPLFDKEITIHHLLTHTSGIPDYFDEEVMSDFEELWVSKPMYHIRRLKDFLPLFQNEKMKYQVGDRFHYNNAGYIVLGLIVEQATNLEFTEYVEQHIFQVTGMIDSGYFSFDCLPTRTATGYIDLEDGSWKTNIYSLPVKGGSDGGAFVTTLDMTKFWESLFYGRLLREETLEKLLIPHAESSEGECYGYGIWIHTTSNKVVKYHVMGYDPGVSFHSAYYPHDETIITVCSNQSSGAYRMTKEIEDTLTLLK
ncbi:serine hydrolase domain-containing protein [Bacillus suaedaesalsae]|uniref:Serine hydrolase n=1 Tax=Bacillus suaedaesalsae TaxID=2810349 RepID=A0ABS2DCU0_9BACI|nr:serine hydrolase [Bacillus suaedaesalsae]MBM6616257.1 serine hydrolase [Bacillus suaedaesalsae]